MKINFVSPLARVMSSLRRYIYNSLQLRLLYIIYKLQVEAIAILIEHFSYSNSVRTIFQLKMIELLYA